MERAGRSRIHALIERVQAAVESERNQRRLGVRPTGVFGLEQPIAEARIFGFDANRYFSDPLFYFEHALRLKLWRWETFPDDDAPITADVPAWLNHYPEYTFVGLSVGFFPSGVPLIQTDHPLTHDPNLGLLEPVDFQMSGWMPRILRWYDDLREIADGRLNVTFNMVWWRGCLDLAMQLRGYENFVLDMLERPAFAHELLRFLVEQRCRWWDAYYRHFDLPVAPGTVADDWINVPFITPTMFADFVLPRYLEIEGFHGGISHIHSCGNQVPVQRYLLAIESLDNLEVSMGSDLIASLHNIPRDKGLGIALHANDVLCATQEEMEARLRFITNACDGRRYSIGTSGLTPIWDDLGEFDRRIRMWTEAVQTVLGPLRQRGSEPAAVTLEEEAPLCGI